MNEKKYEITNIAHPHYPWLHHVLYFFFYT